MAKKEKQTNPETVTEETAVAEEVAEASEIDNLRKELSEANDKFLRLAAEYDNFRKRSSKEKEDLNALCKSTVIKELLPVIDTLEIALSNTADNLEDYKKGVEMIGKQFFESLSKLKVESFGEVGDAFDPNIHNAVMHIEDENLGESVISQVFSKGYRFTDERVIRPAMVQVAN